MHSLHACTRSAANCLPRLWRQPAPPQAAVPLLHAAAVHALPCRSALSPLVVALLLLNSRLPVTRCCMEAGGAWAPAISPHPLPQPTPK